MLQLPSIPLPGAFVKSISPSIFHCYSCVALLLKRRRQRCSRSRIDVFSRLDQLPQGRVQRGGNSLEVLDREIPFASFDGTDVRAMKLATFGKLLLVQAELEPLGSNDIAQVSQNMRLAHV